MPIAPRRRSAPVGSPVGSNPPTGTGAPPRTAERARKMREYTKILQRVRSIMGVQDTSSAQLESAMRRFGLVPSEVGALGKYKARMEKLRGQGSAPKYGIYNTMEGPPGQHWFCCYGDYKYDPLGNDRSNTQEQPDNTDDCGQRCIAYLLMCRKRRAPVYL